MEYYLIKETLNKTEKQPASLPYITLMNSEEWNSHAAAMNYRGELLENFYDQFLSKADVGYDYLCGSFCVPDRSDVNVDDHRFGFVLFDEQIIFIDDENFVKPKIDYIASNKKWLEPSIGRFLYDFIDQLIKDDLRIMEAYEIELEQMEERLVSDKEPFSNKRLYEIRSTTRYLMIHYDQLIDLSEEFNENENDFFKESELNYFHKLTNRLERQYNILSSIRDHALQLQDMEKEKIDFKQNTIMTILTVVTTIFLPLTLITGWYGMNFKYMPELDWPYAYPTLMIVFVLISIAMLYYFKRKKWL